MLGFLEIFPLLPLMLALLIPLIYILKYDRKSLKSILLIILCSLAIVVFYSRVIYYLNSLIPLFGYSLGKFILFVLFPIITVFDIEHWNVKDIFSNLGVRRKGIWKSIAYGLLAAAVTIIITIFVSTSAQFDLVYRTIMFFEAFTEEFFFRGFLFLYLLRKTNRKIAYATSILGFVMIHPQHFTQLFLISTIAQGVLLTIVADKTENVIGPWVSHGLNRFVPMLIKTFLGI